MSAKHVISLLCFERLMICASACFLGYNIISIRMTDDGRYDIGCSQRALPTCPKVCTWTNQTCEEYATRRHWNKTHLIVTNMTYSYPLKASGYPRDDTDGGQTKSLHRRCCLEDNIEATKCHSVVWNADQPNGKFDVLANAESDLKCATNNAYIRDVQQRSGIQRSLILDMCCMKYPRDHSERVVCAEPKNGETQAGVDAALKISLGVSLPLALGIGIPLLICEVRAALTPGKEPVCPTGVYIPGPTLKECCALCVRRKAPACAWIPKATAIMLNYGTTDMCAVCASFTGAFIPAPAAGEYTIIPRF